MNLAALKNQRDARGRTLQIELIHEGTIVPGYGYCITQQQPAAGLAASASD